MSRPLGERAAALHEAGHAIVGARLGQPWRAVEVRIESGRVEGMCVPLGCPDERVRPVPVFPAGTRIGRGEAELIETAGRAAAIRLAGLAAEAIHHGRQFDLAWFDRTGEHDVVAARMLLTLVGAPDDAFRHAAARAWRLAAGAWPEIVDLADRLLTEGRVEASVN